MSPLTTPKGNLPVRNAVIRKKLIKENALIRRYFLYPQRIIIGATPEANWPLAEYRQGRLGIWAA